MENIIATIGAALVSGVVTLVGVIIANSKSRALTDYKISELTKEVKEHNGFAKRMPVVEEKINVINHRLDDLEQYHK
jgi:hypothetical protein